VRPSENSSSSLTYLGVLSFFLFVSVIFNIYALSRWISFKLTDSPKSIEQTEIVSPAPSATIQTDEEELSSNVIQEEDLSDKTEQSEVVALDEPPKYGHLPYAEANRDNLVIVSSFGLGDNQRFEKLKPAAAAALMQMINQARDEGVWIVLLSGFREYDNQAELFAAQVQRRGTPDEAAKSSAPAGYSEHHTGFAMDLGDGHAPSTDINQGFASTEASIWLLQHASEFGFELSFPVNNDQGVSYEPWHWRFAGDVTSQEIFQRANSN